MSSHFRDWGPRWSQWERRRALPHPGSVSPLLLSCCELVSAIPPTPCPVLCCGGPKFRNSYSKDTFPSVRCPQRTLCCSNTGKTRSLVKRQWHSTPVGANFYSVTLSVIITKRWKPFKLPFLCLLLLRQKSVVEQWKPKEGEAHFVSLESICWEWDRG